VEELCVKKSEAGRCSAKGAKYDSQGQAMSAAKRVAPGYQELNWSEHWKCEISSRLLRSFRASPFVYARTQGRRASLRSALAPGYHISRLWRSVANYEAAQSHLPIQT